MKKCSVTVRFLLVAILSYPLMGQITDPKATEVWEPKPRVVSVSGINAVPSDAIVLFDGKNINEFEQADGTPLKWKVKDGTLTVEKGTGDIRSKQLFGDMQLHIEFRTPQVIESEGQGRGNSGIFIQERYELQILDNFQNHTYSNGQAGSIYKQTPPLVNACKPPGQWQTYDIIYKAPLFNADSMLIAPAYITVLHNGIIIHNHTEIKGKTEYIGLPVYKKHGKAAIRLQDHGNPVSFRNIWVREL